MGQLCALKLSQEDLLNEIDTRMDFSSFGDHQGMEMDDDDDEMEVEDGEANEVESEFKDKVLGALMSALQGQTRLMR
ncbi:hypothetical protein RJT34_12987 [Clitoria ternatea]|uniref:Uncharacterized protein n=1 Tax=Clitoria ternatea TaxID=43366 RepID=A0AAN9JQT4_CLITE